MKSKYIFFDIDNTLVSHKNHMSHVPDATREAIWRLKDKGHVPVIATGRTEFLTRRVAEDLGIRLMICANGAQIYDGEKILSSEWMPISALDGLHNASRARPEFIAALDDKFIYTENPNTDFANFFSEQSGYSCIKPFEEISQALIGYLLSPPPAPIECEVFITPPDHTMVESMRTFIELRAAGTSKWRGILHLLESYGADLEDTIAFGDGINDIEMLAGCAKGVAMSIANSDVKAAADLVADDIDDGGILRACIDLDLI